MRITSLHYISNFFVFGAIDSLEPHQKCSGAMSNLVFSSNFLQVSMVYKVLGIKPRASHREAKYSIIESHFWLYKLEFLNKPSFIFLYKI